MSVPTLRFRFNPDTPRLRARVYPAIPPLQVTFRNTGTMIQWRLGEDGAWQDLIEIDDINASVTVGTTTTLAPGEDATVVNSGTAQDAVLDFGIPAGEQGIQGEAATIEVGTVSTVDPGDPATVTNSGTTEEAVFDFEIPQGEAATIAVGTVTTVDPGDPATVTNIGTAGAAIFDFDIPRGAPGTGSVDSVNGDAGPDITLDAGDIPFTPAGTIAATDVQAALQELDGDIGAIDIGVESVVGDGSVEVDITDPANPIVSLDGDADTPGSNKVYGTDGSGVKGWKDDPAGGGVDPLLQVQVMANSLEIADLKGDRMGMVGGIADPFDDETDVDTATSTNESYSAASDLYSPSANFDANTKLVIHFDGADAATSFVDSVGAKAITANGNAQVDTAQSKFGGASGLFDGSGDYLSLADHADWDFGTGDFTVDFWMKTNSWPTTGNISALVGRGSADNFRVVQGRTGGGNAWVGIYLGTTSHVSEPAGLAANDSNWHHVEIVRSGTTLYIFIDGVSKSWTSGGTSSYNISLTDALLIGGNTSTYLNGWMDELRLSNSARHTSGFTAPTSAYGAPNDMTLVSNGFTAAAQPDTARVVVQVIENEAITVNTDLTAEVSRDGGTTWTAATLALTSTTGTAKMYADDEIDISGQPSGTSMKWRIKTLNNKSIDVSGVVLQWS